MRKFTLTSARLVGLLVFVFYQYGSTSAQVLHTESFDGTTFAPPGWIQGGSNQSYLTRVTSGTNPTQSPHSGAGEVRFNSYSLSSGTTLLVSPVVDLSGIGSNTATISFWWYRDGVSYNTSSYDNEGVTVSINTLPIAGGTTLGFIPRRIGAAPIEAATGWYQYSFNVPGGYTSSSNYFIFTFNSQDGDNCFMDDVQWYSFPQACTGTPNPGNIIATANPVCPGNPVTFSLQNNLNFSGITYQWQTSADSITWTFSGADTLSSYSNTFSVPTFIRAIVTCTGSALSDTTAGLQIAINPLSSCYCTPPSTTCTSSDVITNVTFAGINNSSSCGTNGYTHYDSTANVLRGAVYPISVSVDNGGTENVAVWIDYNQNGVFDTTEFVAVGSGTGGVTFTNNITIPVSALPGLTTMRVRDRYNTALENTDACGTYSYGETEDYLVNISASVACNPPTAGTITGDSSACSGNTAALVVNGETPGTSIQWQSSPDNSTWTDIAGATDTAYTTDPITAITYYRVKITCLDSAFTPSFTVLLRGASLCYCVPGVTDCNLSDEITNVTFGGINNSTTCGNNGYSTYGLTATVMQGSANSISVHVNNGGTENVAAWIDYNQNGVFDSSEITLIGSGTGGVTFSNTINVPLNALTGITGMRIRDRYNTALGGNDACIGYTYGETEDYLVNIVAFVACTDPPTAGSISGVASFCSGDSTTLTLSGETLNTTIQWQQSADSITWTDIAGANGTVYATGSLTDSIYYRVKVSCTSDAFTNAYLVNIKPASQCYCGPPAIGGGTSCSDSYLINSASITATTLSTSGICNINGGVLYTQFPDTGSATATLQRQVQYTINVSTDATGGLAAWIDYNQDGVFDASENLFLDGNTVGGVESFTFTVPNNALLGETGLRIRSRAVSFDTTDACGSFGSGETEDYTITIGAAPACTNPPVAGTITGDTGACFGFADVLTLNGQTLGTSLQWQSSVDGVTWADVQGATNPTYGAFISGDSVFYRVKVTCADSSFTPAFKITVKPFNQCYCTPPATDCNASDVITNVTFAGINNNTACSNNGYSSYTSPVATVQQSSNNPISVTVDDGGDENVAVWIDYNHNGIFEPSEYTFIGSGTGVTLSGSISIPANAMLGVTGMRVRDEYGSIPGDTDVCIGYTYGETEDYLVNIQAPCAVTVIVDSVVNVACYGDTTGAVYITVTGGTPAYTYSWTGGNTAEDLVGIAAGTYTVTVTDAQSCTAESTPVTITQPGSAISASAVISDQTGGSANGSITQTVTGGTPPYTYLWNTNDTTENLVNIYSGNYSVTITDSAGCTLVAFDTVHLVTALENLPAGLKVGLFPNPSNGKVFISIESKTAESVDIEVYDVNGQLIMQRTEQNALFKLFDLEFDKVAAGIYMAKIKVGDALINRPIVITR